MNLIYIINFLLAISTTIGMTIIPFLVTDSLGLSLFILGIIEGATEFLSNALRLTNGILFDKLQNKRAVFVSSVGIAFLAKLLLLLPNAFTVICSKVLERVANGAFASPRDAYVAEKAKNKGLALGLLSFSKSAGCILGPLVVSLSTIFLGDLKNNLEILVVLCLALVAPAFILSFSLNISNVKKTAASIFSLQEIKATCKQISPILWITFFFFLGRFNDGLLMMYLKQNYFPEWFYLSTISIFNFTMLLVSPIIGSQIDNGRLKSMVYLSIGALCAFSIFFYHLSALNWTLAIAGLVAWGIQRTGAQIVLSSLIFKNTAQAYYGTAIGIFYLTSGVATMIASFFCGYIAKNHFTTIFVVSGCCSLAALVLAFVVLNNMARATVEDRLLKFS